MNVRLSKEEWNLRIDSLALSIVFPGVLYYLGVLAEEQLCLMMALYLFLFWGFWFPVLCLVIILLSIDFGNSIVAIFFVLAMVLLLKIRKVKREMFFLCLLLLVFFALFIGYQFLELIGKFGILSESLTSKSDAMFNALDGSDLLTKYPIFLRPVVTFMSFVFMTPSGIKVPFLYIIVGFFVFVLTFKVFHRKKELLDLFWFAPMAVIVFFVLLFPTYANAKYYIFMMPFFVYVVLHFYGRKRILIVFTASTIFVFVHLILYRI